jgi:hypothetical protein
MNDLSEKEDKVYTQVESNSQNLYTKIKSSRKRIFEKWYEVTKGIKWLEKLIIFQHKYLPIPVFLYDYLFRLNIIKVLLNFYGYHIWHIKYDLRKGNQKEYWDSKDSLYWHFWRQTDKDSNISQILKIPQIIKCLDNNSLTACELGFGLGKYYRQHWRYNNLKKYLAVDTNKFVCDYNKRYYKKDKNLQIINSTAEEFMNSDHKFDILISSGEVFAYIDPKSVDNIFKDLKPKGVKIVIIIAEGTINDDDIIWPDGTIEYNFKRRLIANGFEDKQYYFQEHENKVLKYIVMC